MPPRPPRAPRPEFSLYEWKMNFYFCPHIIWLDSSTSKDLQRSASLVPRQSGGSPGGGFQAGCSIECCCHGCWEEKVSLNGYTKLEEYDHIFSEHIYAGIEDLPQGIEGNRVSVLDGHLHSLQVSVHCHIHASNCAMHLVLYCEQFVKRRADDRTIRIYQSK